jgi:hypothetical protein
MEFEKISSAKISHLNPRNLFYVYRLVVGQVSMSFQLYKISLQVYQSTIQHVRF